MKLLAAVLLLASSARAQTSSDLEFAQSVRAALAAAKPDPRAAPGIGAPQDPKTYAWLDKTTFRGPFGLKLDRSCMAYEGQVYPTVPDKFVKNLKAMHAQIQKCASERVLPASVGLLYDRAPKVRIDCDPKACEYDDPKIHAWACADSSKLEVTFKEPAHYMEPTTIFHELLHTTKHVDNQTTEEHSHHWDYPLRDEVYFWERHCFNQPDLIKRLKEGFDEALTAAKLTRDESDTERLKAVRKAALQVCATPFRYNVRRTLWANEREIEAVCGQYADYLMMEYNLARQVRALTEEAGRCSQAADKDDCPASEFFTEGSKERAVLEKSGLIPPPRGVYSAKAFDRWTQDACVFSFPDEAAGNPAGALALCAQRLNEYVNDPDRVLALFSEGVEWEQIFRLQRYFKRLHLKAQALVRGPGQYEKAVKEPDVAELTRSYAAVHKTCSEPEVKDGRFCKNLGLDEPPMRLLSALHMHWKPKTLQPARGF